MIIDKFMNRVQKHIKNFKKSNQNILNEFKIQMYQTKKQIERQIIKNQFGLNSNLMNNKSCIPNKITDIETNDKNLSTNYHSRDLTRMSVNMAQIIQQNAQFKDQKQFLNNSNQQNEDPNKRYKTDISAIEQFYLAQQNGYKNRKNSSDSQLQHDNSMEINTVQVRKKYQKFVGSSPGWTMSAQINQERVQNKGMSQFHPFCTQFIHEPYHQIGQSEQQKQNEGYFTKIKANKYQNAIIQEQQSQQWNQSKGY